MKEFKVTLEFLYNEEDEIKTKEEAKERAYKEIAECCPECFYLDVEEKEV